jgi:hypothetical protein
VTALGDIAGDAATLRINGAQINSVSTDQGTGNYGNYALYFFARAGTSGFLNGQFYGAIVRGSAAVSSAAQITTAEAYMSRLTGV